MAKPLAYDDAIYTAMGALITAMEANTRISAVQRGYWTELARVIAATENPDSDLVTHVLQSFREFFTKMMF